MSGATLTIEIQDSALSDVMSRLQAKAGGLTPLLGQIGEAMTESTLKRFVSSTAPDGSRWAPNAQSTYLKYLGGHSRSFGKDGRITARGTELAIAKKPLIGETRMLSTQIHYQVRPDGVAIGSNQIYSAVQQFGALKGAFGLTRHGSPIPWGNIPARPFLGISDEDRVTILSIAAQYFNPGV